MKTKIRSSARAGSAALAALSLFATFGLSLAQAATVTCTTVTACVFGQNTAGGYGVQGSSVSNVGLVGTTYMNPTGASNGRAGVVGYDASKNGTGFNSGVFGTSATGVGIKGLSTSGTGVAGFSTSGIAVAGNGGSALFSTGVSGVATGAFGNGLYGEGPFGIVGVSTGTDVWATGVLATAGGNAGVESDSISGSGVVEGPAILATTNRSDTIAKLPPLFIGTNYDSGTDVVSIDASGNTILAGTLTQKGTPLFRTANSSGPDVASFGDRTSSPSLEDMGEGRLAQGAAYVRLDPTFASTIDPTAKYLVFVTPQGDSRGLYVTELSPQGFAVKESANGRSSLAFDYRIVAKPFDAKAMRLPAMSTFPQLAQRQKASPAYLRLHAMLTARHTMARKQTR